MKYVDTSSNFLIEGAVSLTSTEDLQDILVRQNVTYLLNSQPKFHNIERGAIFLDSTIITTNIGKIFVLCEKNVTAGQISVLWTLGLCREMFDRPMK